MRLLLALAAVLLGACGEELIPKTIRPWSEYQKEVLREKTGFQRGFSAKDYDDASKEQRAQAAQLSDAFTERRRFNEALATSAERERRPVIRPQLRRITEPADFAREAPKKMDGIKTGYYTGPVPKTPPGAYGGASNTLNQMYSRRMPQRIGNNDINEITPEMEAQLLREAQAQAQAHAQQKLAQAQQQAQLVQAQAQAQFQAQQTQQQSRGGFNRVITNGVPVEPRDWNTNRQRPSYATSVQNRPHQLAAQTFSDGGMAPLQYTNLAPASVLPHETSNNIVNSIFAQSQQRAAPTLQLPTNLIPNIPQQQGFVPQMGQAPPAAGVQGLPLQLQQLLQQNPNAFEGMLASGSPMDALGKIAKNLMSMGGGGGQGGQNELFNMLTSALTAKTQPLTSSAVHDEVSSPLSDQRRSQPPLFEKLISSAASAMQDAIKQQEKKARLDQERKEKEEQRLKDSEVALKPEEKKTEDTKKNDEESSLGLPASMSPEQRALLEMAVKSGEIDAEALAPAINSLVKEDAGEESKKEKESRLIEWIRQNRPAKAEPIVAPNDKLPYYGKYCGSLAEQNTTSKRFKSSGAVWAVDNRRIIISKFHFQPGSLLTENVTFWLGPLEATSVPVEDMFPSKNGFYVRPQKLDVKIFAIKEIPPLEARARKAVNATLSSPEINGNSITRRKREDVMPPKEQSSIKLVVQGSKVQVQPTFVADVINATLDGMSPNSTNEFSRGFRLKQPEDEPIDYSHPTPLEWYAGFQPLLLTLPDNKWMKTVNWVSLRDHKRGETVSAVMIPNGDAFHIPSVVQIRALSPNGLYNISSGPIKVLDTKTIEISSFSLRTEGVPVWFMIGKDIIPNHANGHIVPLYNRATGEFDCESLRDYYAETITLRLPGGLDIKDVFWLSVFSIPQAVSYSHLYIPYNDMHLPPDLNGVPTPHCKYVA